MKVTGLDKLCSPDDRGGCWEVKRVVSQAELDNPDPTLAELIRKDQSSGDLYS